MGVFDRPIPGLWQQKPEAWGPVELVRRAVREYYETAGMSLLKSMHCGSFGTVDLATGILPTNANQPAMQNKDLYYNQALANYINCGPLTFSARTGDLTLVSLEKLLYHIAGYGPAYNIALCAGSYEGGYYRAMGVGSSFGYPELFNVDAGGNGVLILGPRVGLNANLFVAGKMKGTTRSLLSGLFGATLTKTEGSAFTRPSLYDDFNVIATGGRINATGVPADRQDGLQDIDWVFNSELTDDQIAQLHDNPYAAIQPRSWPSYFFVGGGAAPTTYIPNFMNFYRQKRV